MFKNFKQDPSGSVASLLAAFNIPLADVFLLDNLPAHIISSKQTSCPDAMLLQMPSRRKRY
jgi:hypothetical protein